MRITYVPKRFGASSLQAIERANRICTDYAAAGYDLTLRQLFYQFVSRDWIPNTQQEYKRLGSILNDARLAGMIDWNHIVDRTRNLQSLGHWGDPADIISSAADSYREDLWSDQDTRVECWIEKDALAGVLAQVCPELRVSYFSCRGYTSQSEIWGAARRIGRVLAGGQDMTILHLGDHDPSGIDMTRDIEDRLRLFLKTDERDAMVGFLRSEILSGRITNVPDKETDPEGNQRWYDEVYGPIRESRAWGHLTIDRIALNMDQIDQYQPPPNPMKFTDARARGYAEEYGEDSWELDALPPDVLADLIRQSVYDLRDEERWDTAVANEEEKREVLNLAANRWAAVTEFLTMGDDLPPDDGEDEEEVA
jgi:hypothetical protein